jgi:hypothetical protein
VAGKKRERSVLSVKDPLVDEERNQASKECTTQHDIFDAAKPVLIYCFSGAFSLPFYSGRFFDVMRFIGDSDCAQQVLEGTYIVPE